MKARIMAPAEYIGPIMTLGTERRGVYKNMTYLDQQRVEFDWEFPLGEIILDFFDKLKSISRGYASLDYEMLEYRASDLVRLDMLINGDPIDAFSVIIHEDKAYDWGRKIADKLKELIPRQLFEVAIQAAIGTKVIARTTVKAAAQGRAREVLRRRHHAQAQAPREAEGRKEAHEAGRLGGDSAGSVSRRPPGRLGRAPWPSSLVIQTSFLGDMVLTTPLLAQLAQPRAGGRRRRRRRRRRCSRIIRRCATRHRVRQARRGPRGWSDFLALAATAARARGTTSRYLAQGSLRSARARAASARIPTRIGFATSAGRWFYTTRVRVPRRPASRRAAAGARAPEWARADARTSCVRRCAPGDAERAAVDALLARARRRARASGSIALAPGSVWGDEAVAVLSASSRERSRTHARVVVIGGRGATRALAQAIVAAVPSAVDATGELSLLASAELIGRAAVIVTNDSAPLHLASAMGTPTVAIFGPTVPEFGFGPLAPARVGRRARRAGLPAVRSARAAALSARRTAAACASSRRSWSPSGRARSSSLRTRCA